MARFEQQRPRGLLRDRCRVFSVGRAHQLRLRAERRIFGLDLRIDHTNKFIDVVNSAHS